MTEKEALLIEIKTLREEKNLLKELRELREFKRKATILIEHALNHPLDPFPFGRNFLEKLKKLGSR